MVDNKSPENTRKEEKKKVIDSEEESESDEEESESDDEENDKFSPTPGEDYDWDGFPEFLCPVEGSESDEEVILDSDRHELDRGFNFVVSESRTVTNPRRPLKTYIPRNRKQCSSVLYNLDYPLATLTKLALATYNEIRGTSYEYVGLVKAYKAVVGGFEFTIRFKACLKDQCPIDFQAIVYKGIPEKTKPGKIRRDCDVRIKFVYPLP